MVLKSNYTINLSGLFKVTQALKVNLGCPRDWSRKYDKGNNAKCGKFGQKIYGPIRGGVRIPESRIRMESTFI